MSYRLQILHGSSYGYSEQITKVKKYKKYISTHNSAIFWATDSRFCMEVHFPQSTKIKLGRGFRDFRPCSTPVKIHVSNSKLPWVWIKSSAYICNKIGFPFTKLVKFPFTNNSRLPNFTLPYLLCYCPVELKNKFW